MVISVRLRRVGFSLESVGQGSPKRVWEIGDSWEAQVLPRDNTTWETVARPVMSTLGAHKAYYLIGELSQILEEFSHPTTLQT